MKLFQSLKRSSRFLLLAACFITIISTGSLGIVWFRVEISRIAEDSRKLERDVADYARELRGLNAKRAKALNPSSLKMLVSNRLGKPSRVVFVNGNEFERRQSFPPPQLSPFSKVASRSLRRMDVR